MDSMKRLTRYKFKNTGKAVLKLWIVVILLDIFSLFMNLRYGSGDSFYLGISNFSKSQYRYSVLGINMLPIVVFFIANAYENYYKDFSRLVNFSMTRKNIFKANVLSNISIAFIFSLIQSILFKLDPWVVKKIGRTPLYDFGLFNIATDTWLFIFGTLFITFLTFISLWQIIAALNYKFGAYVWLGILGIFTIGNNVIINSYSLFDLILPGDWLNMEIDLNRLIIYFSIIVISQVSIYLTNKTLDVKS